MSPPASSSRLGAEFDAFLFAPIGEDRNGLTLSIVSLLGRMDLDPWQEAAKLAGLPAEIAARRLATLLAALSDPSLKPADVDKMAIRLIAQLPGRPAADLGSLGAPRIRGVVHPRVLMTAILFVIWTIWLLGMPATDPHDAPTPTHTDSADAPTPLTVSSPVRPTLSGK
jgi:hypothetical protein